MTVTAMSHQPESTSITPLHLSIDQRWTSGSTRNIHMLANSDLGVLFSAASKTHPASDVPPANIEDTGVVVVSLGVDGDDHDEVHYSHRNAVLTDELLSQAIDALTACRDALGSIK